MINVITKKLSGTSRLKNISLKSRPLDKLGLSFDVSESMAERYKKECLEALMSGTVYSNAKEMTADSKNF